MPTMRPLSATTATSLGAMTRESGTCRESCSISRGCSGRSKTDQVDTIVHLAAMSHPQLSVDFPITTVVGNINGTVSVLEAARISAVKRVVKISSESAYGNQPAALISESCRLEPTTPYGVTKAAGEMFAAVYANLYGLDITSLRVTEVYGPGNRVPQMLCEVIDTVLRGDAFVLDSGADHPFQFVHVRDVAAAIALAAQTSNLPLPAYNVSSGRVTTLGRGRGARGRGRTGRGYPDRCRLARRARRSGAVRSLGRTRRLRLRAAVVARARDRGLHRSDRGSEALIVQAEVERQ